MTPWFVSESWSFVVTKTFTSKIEFFIGLAPAWYRFVKLTYGDIINQSAVPDKAR